METAITLIQTLGFPIACVVALGLFAYYFITRIQDENLQRENKLAPQNGICPTRVTFVLQSQGSKS